MKTLVTGGAGFIGANLVRMLIEKSYQVLVLDDLSVGNSGYWENADVRFLEGLSLAWIEGSILDPKTVCNAVEWADSVIHLAAQASVVSSVADPVGDDFSINVIGSLNVLEACRASGTKRFVFASSSAAQQCLSPYGAAKRAIEGYCLAYHATYGLKTISLRLTNVYGPYSAHKNSVIAKWFKSIRDTGEITICGWGQTRDFIHVDDVCRAIIASLESDVSGEVLQVGTGVETSISGLASMVTQQINDVKLNFQDARENETKRSCADIAQTELMLGWKPTINLIDGLRDTWEWFK